MVKGRYFNPDDYLETESGRVFTPERSKIAFEQAYTDLERALRSAPSSARLYVVVGVQGAGKTTWILQNAPGLGESAFFFDAALPRAIHRARAIGIAKAAGVPAISVWIRSSLEAALAHNESRVSDHRVSEFAIRSVHSIMEPPSVSEGFLEVRSTPTSVDMQVVVAQPEHCRAVAELHVASWQAAYAGILPADYLSNLSVDQRESSWQQVLAERRSELYVARTGTSVVGVISFGPCRDADAPAKRGEVWAIYVLPGAWSTGVGRLLWETAHERLLALGFLSVSLWVIEGNVRAIRFYSSAGLSIEPGSGKEFELGGAKLREIRMITGNTG